MSTTNSTATVDTLDYEWIYSYFDTSRIFIFLSALVLIIYGSFRANQIDQKEDDEDYVISRINQSFHTIETSQALVLPICASVTLITMFFFFHYLQLFFIISTSILATTSISFLISPLIQRIVQNRKNRLANVNLVSLMISIAIVLVWAFTGHWLLMDLMGMGLCVTMIAFIRLSSLKSSAFLLFGLLVYDVFWVFFSEYIFNVNVMVKVATQPAYNPLNYVSNKLNIPSVPSTLSLPGKLVFPSLRRSGHFSMLGLGDIVMPGLLLSFVLRYDTYFPSKDLTSGRIKMTYFTFSLCGYSLGLALATMMSEKYRVAQPALLYLVPFTMFPLVVRAYFKGDLRRMWNHPFQSEKILPS